MAISLLYNPMPTRLFEADGDFASGALAYFYLARTSTPLVVYTDSPLAVPHPWPVVADAYGLLPPIYLATGTEYKVRIEDALGSLLYAADGIANGAGSGGSLPVDAYSKAQSDATFVNVDGDEMTGDLTISKPSPGFLLEKPASGTSSRILGQLDGKARWMMALGDDSAEDEDNVGSDFKLSAYNDAGALLSTPLTVTRATAKSTLTGDMTISKSSPSIVLNKVSHGETCGISSYTANNQRWLIQLNNGDLETGGNVGANFAIHAYNDAGTYISTPLQITRATNTVTIPTLNSSVVSAATLALSSGYLSVGHGGAGYGFVNTSGFGGDGGNGLAIESGSNPLMVNKISANGTAVLLAQNAATCGSISVANGNSAAYNTTSDGRLKEDRQSFDAGPILDATEVYDFKWTGSEARGHGVIAQEAVEVFPEAIHYDEEADSWGADYSKYVPLLIQEVKALRARVAELEAR